MSYQVGFKKRTKLDLKTEVLYHAWKQDDGREVELQIDFKHNKLRIYDNSPSNSMHSMCV